MGWARLLRDGRLDPPTTQRGIEIILKNGEDLSRIISELDAHRGKQPRDSASASS
jgi:hypothetical protein